MKQSYKSILIGETKEEEENNGERREWSQLPDDLLLLIASSLNLKDSLMLRLVCLEWHDTINDAIANKQFHPLPTPPFMMQKQYLKIPSLSLKTRRGIKPNGSSSLIQDEDYEKVCHGSVEGWLVMSDDYSNNKSNLSFFFLNPVIGCRISVLAKLNFPSKSHLERKKLNILKVVVSSKPHRNSSSCFLVVHFNDFCHIAFCKLSDESWTMIRKEEDEHDLMDVLILDNKLYVRTNRCILVYNLQDSSNGDPPKSKILTSLPIMIGNSNPQPKVDHIVYIAKDEELRELYLIYMKLTLKFNTPPQIVTLSVYKLCLSNETSKFMKVDNLGDRVLFLDGSYHMAMSRAKFNYTQELIAANSIYFLICFPWPKDPWKGFNSGIFSLTDNKIKFYDNIDRTSDELEPSRPIWFSPSLV